MIRICQAHVAGLGWCDLPTKVYFCDEHWRAFAEREEREMAAARRAAVESHRGRRWGKVAAR